MKETTHKTLMHFDPIKEIKEKATIIKHYDRGYTVYDSPETRYIESADGFFHLYFRKKDGLTLKWGKTMLEDPPYCPFGNEIADIEITKACRGIRVFESTEKGAINTSVRKPCVHCYKSNTPCGSYMNFETFKKVFDLLNRQGTMTQIAFGVDAEASEELNPDIWKIFQYTRDHDVVPNVTVADITQATAEKIVSLCGACAVSAYQINKNCCYDSVKLLLDEAKKQEKKMAINIHLMVSQETLPFVFEVIKDYKEDPRLQGMNAIVLLALKQKGRGTGFHKVSDEDFKKVVEECLGQGMKFGMDSCSATKFLRILKDRADKDFFEQFIESCESTLYSLYIDHTGTFYPCSFMEKEGDWEQGIDMLKAEDFYEDVWMHPKVVAYRNAALKCIECNGCNSCPYYDV